MITGPSSTRSTLLLAVNGEILDDNGPGEAPSRAAVVRYLEDTYGTLPAEAHDFTSFETPDGIVRAEAFVAEGIDAWTLRFSAPDHAAPGQDWIVEVSSVLEDQASLFSCRMTLYAQSPRYDAAMSAPGVLRALCRDLTFQSRGFPLHAAPRVIGVDLDVDRAVAEFSAPDRWWNCLVLSQGQDAARLQAALTGVANVFVLAERAEMEFAAAVGHDMAVPRDGLRTYRPGFDTMYSEPTAHPAIGSAALRTPEAVHQDLIADAFGVTIARPNLRFKAPSFAMIRQMASRSLSEAVRSSGDTEMRIAALESQIRSERRNTDEAVALAIQSDEERQSAQDALANEQAINHGLRHRIETLERQLGEMGGQTGTDDPTRYEDIKRWLTESFSSQLRLTPRAEKGLRNARYEKIADVVAGLRLLAGPYRDMRRGTAEPQAFELACRSLGFDETRSMSKVAAGQHGDTYFVQYAGKRHFLERHLKKGTAKDERLCLRIYFFWDNASEMVVIGSLPGHLDV